MLFVLILEQNDHRHHEHDSLHVDDGIHEEIYAEKKNIEILIIKIYQNFFLNILYVHVEFVLQLQV